jgi:hypothetical protein
LAVGFGQTRTHGAASAIFDPIEETDGWAWDALSAGEFEVWEAITATCWTTQADVAAVARQIAEQPDLVLRLEPRHGCRRPPDAR